MDSRRAIFTPFENKLLLELISKKKRVIDNKDVSKIAAQKKNAAFEEICKAFNSNVGVTYRTPQQLRQRYNNLKKKVAKLSAARRTDINQTGLGPSLSQSVDLEQQILALGVATTPLQSRFDSDSVGLECIPSKDLVVVNLHRIEDDNCSPTIIKQEPSDPAADTRRPEVELLVSGQVSEAMSPSPSPNPSIYTAARTRPVEVPPSRGTPARGVAKEASELKIQELNVQIHENRAEHEQIEHELRVELLKKQIAVQEKILSILQENPRSNFVENMIKSN